MYHHSHNHHYHYRPKQVDLYLELSIVLEKLAALNAIVPDPDPLPFVIELLKSQESGEFLLLPDKFREPEPQYEVLGVPTIENISFDLPSTMLQSVLFGVYLFGTEPFGEFALPQVTFPTPPRSPC